MDKQRAEAKAQFRAMPFKMKLEHIWFYYKKQLIALVILIFTLIWTGVQCATKIEYDLEIALYKCTALDQGDLNKLTEIINQQIEDTNSDGLTAANIVSFYANLEESYILEQSRAALMRLQADIAACYYSSYILDDEFKIFLEEMFPDPFESVVNLAEIPEIRELLKLSEDENLYLVTMIEYGDILEKEQRMAVHNNARRIHKFFEEGAK